MLPPDHPVDCACDPELTIALLLDQDVHACLSCGKIEYTEAQVDEPRPNDTRCMGYKVLKLDPSVREWLGRWPRRVDYYAPAGSNTTSKYAFLPAERRCRSAEELKTIQERAFAEQET